MGCGQHAHARNRPRSATTLSRRVSNGWRDPRPFIYRLWSTDELELLSVRNQDLVDISVKGADILDIVAAHRSALPSTVAALKTFTQDWDTNLSIPCTNSAGQTVGQLHPSLEGSTCWQLWVLSAEQTKNPGGYTGDGPTPAPSTASSADPRTTRSKRRSTTPPAWPREIR